LFTKQFRIGANAETLEVPAGCIDGNEEPMKAAVREVEEETGRKVVMIRKVGEFFLSPGYTTEKMHLFCAAVGETDLGQHLDGDEFLVIVPMSPKDITEYPFNDMKTKFLVDNFISQFPSWFS
jgi:ADP-ribose pyrophosphatase